MKIQEDWSSGVLRYALMGMHYADAAWLTEASTL